MDDDGGGGIEAAMEVGGDEEGWSVSDENLALSVRKSKFHRLWESYL